MKNLFVVGLGISAIAASLYCVLIMTESRIQIVSTQASEKSRTIENLLTEADQEAAARGAKRSTLSETVSSTTLVSGTEVPTTATNTQSSVKTMAWIYPGNPACSASVEYADGRKIDTLKAEFFTISGGFLTLLNASNTGCNGYSTQTVSRLKQYSTEQYATVSSASVNDMEAFFAKAFSASGNEIETLVAFTVNNDLTGIELDFEDFSSWSPTAYSDYKKFVFLLGSALHKVNKKLMIDGPAISKVSEESWFLWRYADFVSLPVDHIVVMAYDYQYDYGAGSPVAPLSWLKAIVNYTASQYPKEKLTIGLPSYGYQGPNGSYRITILTYDQIKLKKGFSTAKRDPLSGEMTWRSGSTVFFYQDAESLSQKLSAVSSLGITSVSVWHLGGNLWFK